MSLSELLFINRFGIGVISVTVFLVLLVFSFITWEVFKAPDYLKQDQSLASSGERVPASVPVLNLGDEGSSIMPSLGGTSDLETVDLACVKDGLTHNLKTVAKHVRIRGRNCGMVPIHSKETTVVNRSSGVDATVFDIGGKQFTSDFISLVEGENEIWVQLKTQDGLSRIAKIVISKSPKPSTSQSTDF